MAKCEQAIYYFHFNSRLGLSCIDGFEKLLINPNPDIVKHIIWNMINPK
jgi:hypothetical protein